MHLTSGKTTGLKAVLTAGLAAAIGTLAATAAAADVPALGTPWAVGNLPSPSDSPAPAPASSATLPPSTPLTLAELSDFALRQHPSTRAAWAAALIDHAGIDAAQALLRPGLSLTLPASLDRNSGGGGGAAVIDPLTGQVSGGGGGTTVTRSLSPTLSLSWVLFDFGARAAGVDAARWQAAASALGYNRALQSVVSTVEQAYYGLLGARQLQAALQLGVQAAKASLDLAQARRRAGLATIGEAAQAEAAWADASLQAARAAASTRSAEGSLASAIGLPVNRALNLADDAELDGSATNKRLPPLPEVDSLLATARTSRADLIALNALLLQGDAQLLAAQAQGRPTLALSAQANRRWADDGSTRTSSNTQGVALTLSIPIFDGGLVRAQTEAARARVQQLAAQRDVQRQSVELEVWQNFQTADSAEAVISAAASALRSAAVAEAAARERYSAGMGSLVDLLLAQSTLAQARVSVVQARYDARLALAQLGYAVGAGLATALSSNLRLPKDPP